MKLPKCKKCGLFDGNLIAPIAVPIIGAHLMCRCPDQKCKPEDALKQVADHCLKYGIPEVLK